MEGTRSKQAAHDEAYRQDDPRACRRPGQADRVRERALHEGTDRVGDPERDQVEAEHTAAQLGRGAELDDRG